MLGRDDGVRDLRTELREVRDMAVSNKAVLDQRIVADLQHHASVDRRMEESKADRERMHAENSAKFTALDGKLDTEVKALHGRISSLGDEVRTERWAAVKWISGIIGALSLAGLSVLAYLLTNGPPWLAHPH